MIIEQTISQFVQKLQVPESSHLIAVASLKARGLFAVKGFPFNNLIYYIILPLKSMNDNNCIVCKRLSDELLVLSCQHDPCIDCVAKQYFQSPKN